MNNNYYSWWKRTNNYLAKGLIILFTLLVLSQLMLTNQTLKTFVSRTDRLEGKSIVDSQLFIKKGEIEITIENEAAVGELIFYINGAAAGEIYGKAVRLKVKDSDVIEVGAADYKEMAVLRISSVSDNVTVPELGKLIYVNNNLVMVDRVRLK